MAQTDNAGAGLDREPQLRLEVTDDRVLVLLSCDSAAWEKANFYERVVDALRERKIAVIPDRDVLMAGVQDARTRGAGGLARHPIAFGVAPTPPEDARAEWSKDYFNTHYVVDPETGQIDFTRRIGDPNVCKGDLLVVLRPSKPGCPGIDVFGETIPVPRPQVDRLVAAQNVVWDREAGGLRALLDGRVEREGDTIRVENVFEILTSVGGETGSIEHNGSLVVRGDVKDHYALRATVDLEVHGTIYESQVRCGRDLAAMGGISSNHHGSVEVGGQCHVRYANQTTLHSQGRITVEREFYQSEVHAFAEIHGPTARIVGGTTTATGEIIVGEVGSSSGTPTTLALDSDRALKTRIAEREEGVQAAQNQLPDLYNKLRLKRAEGLASGNPDLAKIRRIEDDIETIEQRMLDLTAEIDALVERQNGDRGACVRVRGRAFPGVVFRILGRELCVAMEIAGPFVARLNAEKTAIEFVSDTK